MNSSNIEKIKKVIVPLFLTVGGLWISYVGYHQIPNYYQILKFTGYAPTNQMLEKAWQGFDYNPQINPIDQVYQVLKRSRSLHKNVMIEFTQFMQKIRISERFQDLDQFVESVQQEIELKIRQTRLCIMYFLQYKNYSFEQFYQRNFQSQYDQQIAKMIADHDNNTVLSYDPNLLKLPTINQCISNLRRINPILVEIQPQIDRINVVVQEIGWERYKYVFLITYFQDIFVSVLNEQYLTMVYSFKYLSLERLQPNQKEQGMKLLKEFQQFQANNFQD